MTVLGSTAGSGGDTTSPDPASLGDHWDRYVAWCDHNDRDPFDDTNLDEFDTLCPEAEVDEWLMRQDMP